MDSIAFYLDLLGERFGEVGYKLPDVGATQDVVGFTHQQLAPPHQHLAVREWVIAHLLR